MLTKGRFRNVVAISLALAFSSCAVPGWFLKVQLTGTAKSSDGTLLTDSTVRVCALSEIDHVCDYENYFELQCQEFTTDSEGKFSGVFEIYGGAEAHCYGETQLANLYLAAGQGDSWEVQKTPVLSDTCGVSGMNESNECVREVAADFVLPAETPEWECETFNFERQPGTWGDVRVSGVRGIGAPIAGIMGALTNEVREFVDYEHLPTSERVTSSDWRLLSYDLCAKGRKLSLSGKPFYFVHDIRFAD